jgi:putative sterol carrier protein
MTLADVTAQFEKQAAQASGLNNTFKFQLDEGTVYLDFTGDEPVVHNEDKEADCTITMSLDTMEKLRKGELNPMVAAMTGKVKIKGDMALAMKLREIMGG